MYGYANANGSSYTTAYGQTHTTSYNGLAQYAANQQAAANMADLAYSQGQIRQQIGDGYVKMHTIPAETEYSGFFNVKYNKKMAGLNFTLTIDGNPYTFYFWNEPFYSCFNLALARGNYNRVCHLLGACHQV